VPRRRTDLTPGETVRLAVRRATGAVPAARYLASRLGVNEKVARRLLATGAVRFDGAPAGPDDAWALRPGREIVLRVPDSWPPHLQPTPMELSILYEDAHLAAVDKPAGRVVHPARGHMDNDSMQNGLLWRYREEARRPEATIACPHRLDLDTTGVLLFSRTRAAYRGLTRLFAERRVHKAYLALVEGRPRFGETRVLRPLGVHPSDPTRGAVVPEHEGGRPAETDLYVVEAGADWALLRANPRTGRPHQVRLHCAALGHPVLGDRDYHPAPAARGAPRQMLHAAALALLHPVTGEPLQIGAPLPADMEALLARLRAGPS
jgi:23S rRNA pseudouridine1911/1915/1917 synthase